MTVLVHLVRQLTQRVSAATTLQAVHHCCLVAVFDYTRSSGDAEHI